MKILIVHSHNRFTGVSTFLYTLSKALIELGHSITFFIKSKEDETSLFDKKLEKLGVRVFIHKSKTIFDENDFEQIFFNYNSDFETFKSLNGKKKFFVHGLMEKDYLPPENIDKVFVFGERAFDFIKCNCEKKLIRNFIDVEYFSSNIKPNNVLKNILIFDGRNSMHTHTLILRAASRINAYVSILGKVDSTDSLIQDTREVIEKADLVIAYGRSAIEAMSMGKPTIIYGFNGGDGYLTTKNFRSMLETNLSGWSIRSLKQPFEENIDSIINEFKKYDSGDGIINRILAKNYFSSNLYIKKILE